MMIFSALLLLLMSDATASDMVRSELLPESQSHDWSEGVSERGKIVFIENGEVPAYSDDTGTYPSVLVRTTGPNLLQNSKFLDVIVAIDCDRSMFAVTKMWEPGPQGVSPQPPHDGVGVFVQANDTADEEVLTAIFTHICGPEWKFEPG